MKPGANYIYFIYLFLFKVYLFGKQGYVGYFAKVWKKNLKNMGWPLFLVFYAIKVAMKMAH